MSLFSLDDINTPLQQKSGAKSLVSSPASILRLGTSLKQLEETIGSLEENQVIEYMTAGKWSMHELIEYSLRKIGSARVYLATWTVTEEPVRSLVKMREEGLIRELHCLFDYRIKDRKPAAFELLKSISDSHALVKIHAKVTAMLSDQRGIAILSSANMTKNPRIEAGAVFCSHESAAFHSDWILQEITTAKAKANGNLE